MAHSTLHTFFPQIPSFLASVFGGGGGGTGGVHRLSTLYFLAVVVVELELLLFSTLFSVCNFHFTTKYIIIKRILLLVLVFIFFLKFFASVECKNLLRAMEWRWPFFIFFTRSFEQYALVIRVFPLQIYFANGFYLHFPLSPLFFTSTYLMVITYSYNCTSHRPQLNVNSWLSQNLTTSLKK